MANIGIIHYKVGGTDGVSLELEKWQHVLEAMGHKVFLCGGDLGRAEGTLIEEISHYQPIAKRLYHDTFVALTDTDEAQYSAEFDALSAVITAKLSAFVEANQINYLIAQNVWSVAMNPPVATALAEVMRTYQLPTIAHNHDFYWERVDGVALTCKKAVDLADKFLPPRDDLIRHVVINSLAQSELLARKGIASTVVPNVFDFEAEPWQVDDGNRQFRQDVGLRDDDVVILQATRIVPRKGIELAIDFVAALDQPENRAKLIERGLYDGRPFSAESRIVFVLAGYAQDDATGRYLDLLKRKIEQAGINALFIDDRIGAERHQENGQTIYSLWDSYVFADFVTYPSLWEGWGNQLLETLRAKLPFLLFEYPVYVADLAPSGLRAVSLGQKIAGTDADGLVQVPSDVMNSAVAQAVDLLTDRTLRQDVVEHNFQVGRTHYSMAALHRHLSQLMPTL